MSTAKSPMNTINPLIQVEAQKYLLGCLMEELAEQIQEANKIKRFGANHVCPVSHLTNAAKFANEAADAEAIKWMLNTVGIALPYTRSNHARMFEKIQRTIKYAKYSVENGHLSAEALTFITEAACACD